MTSQYLSDESSSLSVSSVSSGSWPFIIGGDAASERLLVIWRLRLDFEVRQRRRLRRTAPITDPPPCFSVRVFGSRLRNGCEKSPVVSHLHFHPIELANRSSGSKNRRDDDEYPIVGREILAQLWTCVTGGVLRQRISAGRRR